MSNKIRLRYGRREPAIWLAHLDMMRTFERAVRRAGLPVLYSQGYNPRPQLAFALPIGVGIDTLDDYVDILMSEPIDADLVVERLNRSLPAGLTALESRQVPEEGPSLMSLIAAADYRLCGPGVGLAAARLFALPDSEPWLAEKNSKGKTVVVDIKPLVIILMPDGADQLEIRVKAGSSENLRPDLLLQVLTKKAGLSAQDAADTAMIRENLWLKAEAGDGRLIRPFDLEPRARPS